MADNTQNKSLEQLIDAFTSATNQTKELDAAISEFSGVTNSFNETLSKLDKKLPVKEMSNLSEEALKKLREIQAYNEYQIYDKLETVINKSVSIQLKELENRLKDSNHAHLNELKKSLENIEVTAVSSGGNNDEKYEELIQLLQGQQVQYDQPAAPQVQNDEIQRLERRMNKMLIDFKNMEIEYENRISKLEEEIVELRNIGLTR